MATVLVASRLILQRRALRRHQRFGIHFPRLRTSTIRVPTSDGHMAMMEAEAIDDELLVKAQEWVDVEFEVAFDSGSTDNVCHEGDAPGYIVEASAGSKRGQ